MQRNKVQKTDLVGRMFLKTPGKAGIQNYYTTISTLRPFLQSPVWQESTTGFYINFSREIPDEKTARITYFTGCPERTNCILKKELLSGDAFTLRRCENPVQVRVSEQYGGEELRFRRFLCTYTAIGLDIMQKDLFHARCLMAIFRLQVMIARKAYRPHFEPTFASQSKAYNILSDNEKQQFWADLAYWPNPRQVDWAHMMVNMVLPGDFNWTGRWAMFLKKQPAMTIDKINEYVNPFELQIPREWDKQEA